MPMKPDQAMHGLLAALTILVGFPAASEATCDNIQEQPTGTTVIEEGIEVSRGRELYRGSVPSTDSEDIQADLVEELGIRYAVIHKFEYTVSGGPGDHATLVAFGSNADAVKAWVNKNYGFVDSNAAKSVEVVEKNVNGVLSELAALAVSSGRPMATIKDCGQSVACMGRKVGKSCDILRDLDEEAFRLEVVVGSSVSESVSNASTSCAFTARALEQGNLQQATRMLTDMSTHASRANAHMQALKGKIDAEARRISEWRP